MPVAAAADDVDDHYEDDDDSICLLGTVSLSLSGALASALFLYNKIFEPSWRFR